VSFGSAQPGQSAAWCVEGRATPADAERAATTQLLGVCCVEGLDSSFPSTSKERVRIALLAGSAGVLSAEALVCVNGHCLSVASSRPNSLCALLTATATNQHRSPSLRPRLLRLRQCSRRLSPHPLAPPPPPLLPFLLLPLLLALPLFSPILLPMHPLLP
jgi:hypothetical protein